MRPNASSPQGKQRHRPPCRPTAGHGCRSGHKRDQRLRRQTPDKPPQPDRGKPRQNSPRKEPRSAAAPRRVPAKPGKGLLQQLTKRFPESALEGEVTDHLGYDRHEPTGKNGRQLPQRNPLQDRADRGRPRARGDGPPAPTITPSPGKSPPRPRGWSVLPVVHGHAQAVVPAPAEMVPRTRCRRLRRSGARACEDGPVSVRALAPRESLARCPRGWSVRLQDLPATGGGRPCACGDGPSGRFLPGVPLRSPPRPLPLNLDLTASIEPDSDRWHDTLKPPLPGVGRGGNGVEIFFIGI